MTVRVQDTKSVTSMGISWGYPAPKEDEVVKAKRIWDATYLESTDRRATETQTEDVSLDDEERADEGLLASKGAAAVAPEELLPSFALKLSFIADMLLFTERLQVVRDGEVCGTVTLSTERMRNLPGILEVYSSHVTGPDYSVMGLVSTSTLQTTSERRYGPGEGSTFLTNYDGSLHVVIRSSKDAEPTKWNISKEIAACLLGEGASLMLIRYLAVNRFVGSMSLYALLDGDGGLALQTLTSSRGRSDDATQIVRHVRPMRRDLPEFSVECEVTRAGELLWYTRSPGEWWVRTDPRSRLYMTMRLGRSLPPLHTRWREDAQLASLYEDRVQLLAARYGRRVRGLRPLLSDFLLALLAAKPLNAFSFAVDFFTAQAGTRPGDEYHDCRDNGGTTTGLQYTDALFYYERESQQHEKTAEEEESSEDLKRERKSAVQAGGGEAEEAEQESAEYQLARLLLLHELSRALSQQAQLAQQRREEQRLSDERQLRASLFQEAGFAELLVSDAAGAAVQQVEDELTRREECAFRVHPVSICTDQSFVNIYHDQRYGDDFEGPYTEEF